MIIDNIIWIHGTGSFAAMDEYGMDEKEDVKQWYDGFVFGKCREIYNP